MIDLLKNCCNFFLLSLNKKASKRTDNINEHTTIFNFLLKKVIETYQLY